MSNTGRICTLEGGGTFKEFVYFFRAGEYYRFNWETDRNDDGYPQSSSVWNLPGAFAAGFDAAVNGQGAFEGKAYFFKGDQYLRYDWANDRIEEGYPQSMDVWNLPGPFAGGIDAALNGVGEHEGKVYFFKGADYIRYDWNNDRIDEGYPQPITEWKFPSNFSAGIDAAINARGDNAGKAYFFRGDLYLRYDWQTEAVDPGYPASIDAWGLSVSDGSSTDQGSTASNSEFRQHCAALLAKHEGREKHVYLDTLNIPSIGIGFNLQRGGARQTLTSVGANYDQVLAGAEDLTDAQIDGLFDRDLDTAFAAAHRQVTNFDNLHHNARLVVIDMMFMGEARFAEFKKMIAALQEFDYNAAADEIANSQWYVQVKNRGSEDVSLMQSAAG
jgi:GH24 family phage-related lysozyme (muramidase)